MDTDTKPRRKPRAFKVALIILLVLLILFAAGIYFLPHFLPIDTIKSVAKTKSREMLGMDVDFRNLGFSWNGSVVLDGISLAPMAEEGATSEPLLTVDEARTNVSLPSLLSGKIVVNSLVVDGFSVRVRRDADGKLNLPDLSKLQSMAALPQSGNSRRMALSALAADAAPAPALPPIEIHRVDLKKGILSFDDQSQNLAVDVGLDFFRLEGSTLNDPFVFTGRLFPYPDAQDKGDFPFSGRVALVKDGAVDLENGEASLEVDVKSFSLHELADKLGLGALLASGEANGMIKAGFSGGKAVLSVADMRLAGATVGLGGSRALGLPDTSLAMNAAFDPDSGSVDFSDMSLSNDITALKAKGRVEDVYGLAGGNPPAGSIDFSGVTDFAKVTRFVREHDLGLDLDGLPALEGNGSYFGKVVLEKPQNPGDPLTPGLTLDFNEGQLSARDENTGIAASVNLKGVDVRAAARLSSPPQVNANVNFTAVPVAAVVPQFAKDPVNLALNGGVAVSAAGGRAAGELRLANTAVNLPASQWATAMTVTNPEARLTFDLSKDELNIASLSYDINDGVKGTVTGTVAGLLAGAPRADATVEVSTLMEKVKTIFKPLIPDMASKLTGGVRAGSRLRLANGTVEALVKAEIDNADVVINLLPDSSAALEAPKTTVDLLASASLSNPLAITVNALEVDNGGALVRFAERNGLSIAARLGAGTVKATGVVDAAGMTAAMSGLEAGFNGVSMAIGHENRESASLTGGVFKMVAANQENPLLLPLRADGDFNLGLLDAGMGNLVFSRVVNGNREESGFGNIRVNLKADGHLGGQKPRLVNINTATLSSKPLAVSSRARVNLDTSELELAYSALVAPSGLSALMGFLNLPPTLLNEAAASGVVSWNGREASSKGTAKGQLVLASGEVNPFEAAHDLSAAYNPADRSLTVAVRGLGGNVKTANGEAVVTLAAQPSNLFLSRAGSKGMLDIRVNGAAAPTRMLALGLLGVMPQFREHSQLLYNSQAQGVYNAWLIVRDKDESSLSLNLGGIWEGAALQINNTPFLAEAGKLQAALEGEFAYRENRVRLSRLHLRSDSGMMQADGSAEALLAVDQANDIAGIANVNVDLTFVMADLAKSVMVFPGVIPANLGLGGRINGNFKAGGDAADIRVSQGSMAFQGFRATPGGMEVTIPNGAANFDGTISLQLNAPAGQGTPWDVLRYFNIRNGRAGLTGAQLKGRPINTLSGAFQLQNAVLTLEQGQMAVSGGTASSAAAGASASGTVDFNSAAPAVNLRVAVNNFPLSEVNEELKDFFQFDNGVVNLPATQGQSAGVAFNGFSEDEILQTLRLENFSFATGPVTLSTGPVLNAELDKARAIMKQEVKEGGSTRVITFTSISGAAAAAGNGTISFPSNAPINLIGDNISDFRVQGSVFADHTLDLEFFITGKLENLIGFTLPNIIPNLRSGTEEEKNRFMAKMNDNAAKGHYKVKVTGPLEHPNLSGIGEVAGRFIADIVAAAPLQILTGVIDLGKDFPGTLKNLGVDAAASVLNLPETVGNAPRNVINAPKNLGKGLGRVFGFPSGDDEDQQEEQQEAGQQQQQQPDARQQRRQQQQEQLQQLLRPQAQQPSQEEPSQEDQQRQRGLRLPFGIR